jgi:RTX calcium-binding nonapeptide repeat (4 copies)
LTPVRPAALALALATLALGLATPAPAHATRVAAFGPDTRFGFRAEVRITGTAGANRINVAYVPLAGAFVVTDPSGITTAGCERLSDTRARCIEPSNSIVDVNGKQGADTVTIARSVRVGTHVSGGTGNDQLTGGSGDDLIIGNGGDDTLRGRGGDDDLGALFDTGRDAFFGGAGNDDIDASEKQSTPDRTISCGGGTQDYAYVDAHRDPRPTGCEHVVDT